VLWGGTGKLPVKEMLMRSTTWPLCTFMRDVCSHGNNHHYHGRVKLQDGAKDRVHVCLMVEGAEEERRKHAWEVRGEMR